LIYDSHEHVRLLALPVFDKFSAERLALTLNFVHLIWTADVTTVDMFTGKLLICRVIQASLEGDQEFDSLRASMVSAASSIADNKFADAQQVRLDALILRVAQSPDDLSLACKHMLSIPLDILLMHTSRCTGSFHSQEPEDKE
jgi:hypothetical protein